jgi:cytoskeletal protein RodZ
MAELKRKVTLKRKESPQETKKKSKWWLWLLLALIAIVVVILLIKTFSTNESNVTDENLPAQVWQLAVSEQTPATKEPPAIETQVTEETATPANEETVAPEASEQPAATPVAEVAEPASQPSGEPTEKPNASAKPAATLPQGSLEEKAKRVIRGDFGNGIDRKQALGSEYNEIQQKVNEMYRNGEVY